VLLHTAVTIGYDVPWQRVEELLVEAALATEHLEAEPPPFVLQTSLDDFFVTYEINAITRRPGLTRRQRTLSQLHRNIQIAFHSAGVEIASPHLAALRDGNDVNIPEDQLPTDYRPGSFRVTTPGGWRKTHD